MKIDSIQYDLICSNIRKYVLESEPVAYLKESCFFYQIPLKVQKGVFIPQPDTETLIEATFLLINKIWGFKENLEILEIGSGSGNISLSIAKHNQSWKVTGVDINKKALSVAKFNSINLGISNVEFLFSNLFESINRKFDIIVSNPPYISEEDYLSLDLYTKKQPKNSLVAKNNGLWFYQEIISKSKNFLKNKFLVIFEIGYKQEIKIIKILLNYFLDVKIEIFNDFNGNSRIIAFYN
jgi:release factor glutamine methyltransferase